VISGVSRAVGDERGTGYAGLQALVEAVAPMCSDVSPTARSDGVSSSLQSFLVVQMKGDPRRGSLWFPSVAAPRCCAWTLARHRAARRPHDDAAWRNRRPVSWCTRLWEPLGCADSRVQWVWRT